MALIDVDRHILSQISGIHIRIKALSEEYVKEWEKILEVRDNTETALFHCSVCPEMTEACIARERYLKKLRGKIFAASQACNKKARSIMACISKQEALVMHLVSLVDEVDTKKGMETIREEDRHDDTD